MNMPRLLMQEIGLDATAALHLEPTLLSCLKREAEPCQLDMTFAGV